MGSLRTLQNGKLTTAEKAIRKLFAALLPPQSRWILIMAWWGQGGPAMWNVELTITSLDEVPRGQESLYSRQFLYPRTESELAKMMETAERDVIRLALVEWDVPGQLISELDGFEIVADIEREFRFQWPGGIIRIPSAETLADVEEQINLEAALQ